LRKGTFWKFTKWYPDLRPRKGLCLSWPFRLARKKLDRSSLNVHVFPTGRLGNQLYQAAVANSIAVVAAESGLNPKIYWHLTQPDTPDFLSEKPFCEYSKKNHHIYSRLFTKRNLKESPIYVRVCYKVWRMFVVSRYEIVPEQYSISEKFLSSAGSLAIVYPHQEFQFIKKEFVKHIIEDVDERGQSKNIYLNESKFMRAAIHLRFGDFLNPGIIREYGQLSEQYYLTAMEIIRKRTFNREVRWWIFTDDQELASQMIRKLGLDHFQFMSSLGLSDYQELIQFSRHDFLILSNSTFSWWAGYLAGPSATIIAPDPLTLKSDSKKAISPDWILTEARFGLK
jgi:hypothetical protein